MGEKQSVDRTLVFAPEIGGENVETLEKRRIKIFDQCCDLCVQDIEDVLNRIYRWQDLC